MTEDEQMLTSLFKCRRLDLYTGQRALTDEESRALLDMRRRRDDGEPLQYILGQTDFMGIMLSVDRRVLIPRPETELLVEEVIEFMSKRKQGLNILDLGTGCGNIAIALAQELAGSTVLAVDISPEALSVARQNAITHNVDERISFLEFDMHLLPKMLPLTGQFDVIVSNPPYIPAGLGPSLPREVQKEPWVALNGGPDGLDYYRFIIPFSIQYLKNNGMLALEIGDGQKERIEAILQSHADEFFSYYFLKDYAGTDRIAVAVKA